MDVSNLGKFVLLIEYILKCKVNFFLNENQKVKVLFKSCLLLDNLSFVYNIKFKKINKYNRLNS